MTRAPEVREEGVSMRGVQLLRPHAAWLAAVVILLCLLALADMAVPWLLMLLVDDVFVPVGGEGRWGLLWLILPGIGFIYVCRNTLFYASRMRSLRISEDVCFDLRKRIFEHLQQLSMRFYRSQQPGRISARLMDDTFKIQSFIQEKLPSLVRYLLELQILLIIIYAVNWRLALASTIVLPMHFWVYRHFRRSIRRSHSEAQEHLAAAHGNVVERFLGMEVIKGFSAEARESRSFREAIDATRRSTIRSQRVHFAQKVAADLLVGLGTVLLLGYGAWEVKGGRMTGGAFLMFFWYTKMLYPAVLEVISGTGHLSRASASVERIFAMLDEPATEDGVHRPAAESATPLRGRIELEDVAFAYATDGPAVLDGVDLTVREGEHIAITGSSGSGKSTLVSLLPCFNVATGGQVRIDGIPVETLPIATLRGAFGIVFQDLFLFNASIEENLRYARPEATPEEIAEACRITGAHDFIERLPHGYATRIGASGVELSRGEKQRITIARALLRDPRVLILDEATASLDVWTAREIMRAVLDWARGRTVLMVTHETELLDLVDRVVSLEHGRIVFDATPAEFATSPHSPGGPSPVGPITIPSSMHLRHAPVEYGEAPEEQEEPSGRTGTFGPLRSPTDGLGPLILLLLALVFVTGGCVRTEHSARSVTLDDPRVQDGLVLETPDPVDLRRLAEALDEITIDPAGIRRGAAADTALAARAPRTPTLEETASLLVSEAYPREAMGLVAMPRVNATEIVELIDGLVLRLGVEHGYAEAGGMLAPRLPSPPDGLSDTVLLARVVDGETRALRFAYREFASQPPQLWYAAVTVGPDGALAPSPDGALVEPAVTALVGSLQEMRSNLTVSDLESKLVQLSYADAAHAIKVLKGMGISTYDDPAGVPSAVDFATLPFVVRIPDPTSEDIGLIGSETRAGTFGVSLTPNVASRLQPNTLASPMTRLLVMYHPAHPEQFSRARRLIDDFVDQPARQIFVEGMVLEISEDGLRDLGIEWELNEGPIHWRAGSLDAGSLTDTLNFESDDLDFWRVFNRNFEWDWTVKLRTLIRDGKAEILSRPSVLTINNRQSTIRVGTDIPIATSQEGTATASNKIAFSFQYLPTGILLNIRPRITEDGSEVSMLIDTVVSATVPGADLQIRSQTGEVLASAPTVSTRRVQTYARIRNNTPFIIGGLVSREETTTQDKIPLLGDLPLIGAAFRAERSNSSKREVIIVLTPYVLPEVQIGRVLPKDEDEFDSFGNALFRDSYRIRDKDVFDLGFLFGNARLNTYRALAAEAIAGNFELAAVEPFRSFAGDLIPGEEILVTRMIYEVVKRLEVGNDIPLFRMFLMEEENVGGFEVEDLERALAKAADGRDWESFFRRHPDEALAITFTLDPGDDENGRLAREQIPAVQVVKCGRGDEAWSDRLWELNQPDVNGRVRRTILLKTRGDLVRLRRAIAIKRIVALNGGPSQLLLRNFSAGKVLLMPDIKPEQGHIIDPEVARYFFHTEHYYGATLGEIERRLSELDLALRQPGVRSLLEHGLPERESLPGDAP